MAITIDATSSGSNSSTASTTQTVAHTVAAGAILVVGVYAQQAGGTSPTISVTYNGTSMTQKTSVSDSNGGTTAVFYLTNPTSGTNNIVSTTNMSSGVLRNHAVVGASFLGANGIGTNSGATFNSFGTVTATFTTSAANSMIFAFAGCTSTSATTLAGNNLTLTSIIETNVSGVGNKRFAAGYGLTTTTGTYGANLSGGSNSDKYVVDLEITPVTSTNYPVTIAQGSYTYTGQNILLKIGRKMLAAFGSYSLTGQSVILRFGKTFTIPFGSYALTGQNILFHFALSIKAAFGSYALTGQTLLMHLGRKMSLVFGTYAVNGQNVILNLGRKIAIAFGSYAATGQNVILNLGRRIALAQGSYSLTGQAVSFRRTINIVISMGAYILSGQAIRFLYNGQSSRWTDNTKSAEPTYTPTTKNSATWVDNQKS